MNLNLDKKVADALGVSEDELNGWLDGDSDSCSQVEVDNAVIKILGKANFERAQSAARVWDALLYKLGLGDKMAGGVNLEKLLKD